MNPKDVLLLLTDNWVESDTSYVIPFLNLDGKYVIKTIAIDKQSKASASGLRTEIDFSVDEYQDFNNLSMVIIPGGLSWRMEKYDEIANFLKKVTNLHIPIAAICGSVTFLAKHGFLNDVKHTNDTKEVFYEKLKDEKGYTGHENFVSAQVVVDKGFITANDMAAVEFAYEVLKILEPIPSEEIEEWYNQFKSAMV